MLRRLVVLLLLLGMTLGVSGCWGRRETADLGIVGAVALDLLDDGKVLVSLELVNPQSLAPGPGARAETPVSAWVLLEASHTVANAVANIERRVPRWVFMGQVNSIIFGQNLAREGIGEYLDYFARQGIFRRTIFINVCDTGSGLLQRPMVEELPSRTLAGLAMTGQASSKIRLIDLNEFLKKFSEPGIEPVATHTAGRETEDRFVKRQGEDVEQEDPAVMRQQPLDSEENIPGMLPPDSPVLDPMRESGTAENVPGMTVALGLAAFRGDRMVGFLDGVDARGYLWVTGEIREGIVQLADPTGEGKHIALEIVRVRSSIKPRVDGDEISFSVKVDPDFQVIEIGGHLPLGDLSVTQRLERDVSRFVEAEIRSSLSIVQEAFRSDIYGFGQILYRKHPDLWEEVEEDWNEVIFPTVEVDVQVKTRIRSPGALLREG